MCIVRICPEIPDCWKGGLSATARVLGLHPDTVRKYANLGKRRGGIDWRPSKNGRMLFTGKEVKRFWYDYV